MEILYISPAMSTRCFDAFFEASAQKPPQEAQKYNKLLIDGICKNGVSLEVVAVPLLNRRMNSKIIAKGGKDFENNALFYKIPIINIPVIKNIGIFLSVFFYSFRYFIRHPKSAVVCDIMSTNATVAAVAVAKLFGKKIISIVTDVPQFTILGNDDVNIVRRIIFFIKSCFFDWIVKMTNGFVFLTQAMDGLLNEKKKPYVVIEGQVDVNMVNSPNSPDFKYDNRVCIYAGSLRIKYGIKDFVEAFIKLNLPDTELHVYGLGSYADELDTLCCEHQNIKFFGQVKNDVVVASEIKAHVLVNPRPIDKEFVKYSFPSKNMEYMASGTPILTTRLPGMPQEYYDYIYTIDEVSSEGYCEALKKVFSETNEQLHNKGMRAREFVLKNKNNVIQAGKIVDMIHKMEDSQ